MSIGRGNGVLARYWVLGCVGLLLCEALPASAEQQPPGVPLAVEPSVASEVNAPHKLLVGNTAQLPLPESEPLEPNSSNPTPSKSGTAVSGSLKTTRAATAPEPVSVLSEELGAIEARLDALDQLRLSDSDRHEQFKQIYQSLRPLINESIDQLWGSIKQPPLKLSLLDQINNDQHLQAVLDRFNQLHKLFEMRRSIFRRAPDAFWNLYTSSKLEGVGEAKLELNYIHVQLVLILNASYQRVLEIPQRFLKAPVDILTSGVLILAALAVFKLWRRWAVTGFPLWRKRLLDTQPRSQARIRFASLLWYVDNVRSPVEWYVLVSFLLSLAVLQLKILTELSMLVVFWLSMTAFVYLLLIRIIERSKQQRVDGISPRQMSSLKLLVFWIGAYLLNDSLLLLFAGDGALVSWLHKIFVLLLIPVYLLLVFRWQEDAFEFVRSERDAESWIKKLTVGVSGFRGFLVANLCIGYALYFTLSGKILRLLSKVETGRRLTAEIYRKRLATGDDLQHQVALESLSTGHKKALIGADGYFNQAVCQPILDQIEQMLTLNEKSHVALVAERGMGKSTLLELVKQDHPSALVVDCFEEFEPIVASVKQQLGLVDSAKNEQLIEALNQQQVGVVLLDNCHRLASPAAGGQRQLKRLYGWINELRDQVLWVMTFEANTWQLISALNIASGFYSHVIKLKPWSESDISTLLDQRCQQLRLEVRYGHLQIPRQIADIEEDTLEKRNRSGVNRIIWGFAEGNPSIAARVFADSVRIESPADKLTSPESEEATPLQQPLKALATLPNYPDTSTLEEFDINTLLVLRVICQFGRAGTGDLINNLRVHALVVNSAIATCLARGIIEPVGGRYRISWLWLRVVTKFLARQNLLSS